MNIDEKTKDDIKKSLRVFEHCLLGVFICLSLALLLWNMQLTEVRPSDSAMAFKDLNSRYEDGILPYEIRVTPEDQIVIVAFTNGCFNQKQIKAYYSVGPVNEDLGGVSFIYQKATLEDLIEMPVSGGVC